VSGVSCRVFEVRVSERCREVEGGESVAWAFIDFDGV